MNISQFCFLVTALSIITFSSSARIDVTEHISVSGFGSTSITQSNIKTPLFVNREIIDDVCFDCDTTFGIQGDISFTDDFNASLQVVKRPQDNWSSPELEWAYLGYSFSDYNTRAGRLRLPLFLSSEFYYVGQAYTSARPPQEVYNAILGITSYQGISTSWDHELNDELYFTLAPYAGVPSEEAVELGPLKYVFEVKKLAGIYSELSSFDFRVMLSYAHVNYTTTVSNLPMSIIYPRDKLNIYTVGAEYNIKDWFITGEVVMSDIHFNWYSSLSYNVGKFTPYLTYAESHKSQKNNSVLVGVRYDLLTAVSLNAELQYTDAQHGDNGQFVLIPDDDKTDAYLYTLMLNFVF